jgi:hypothetical protein
MIIEQRRTDGCWQVEPPGNVGSPATWGNTLATYFGLRTLRVVDPRRWRKEIEQAQAWLDKLPVRTTPDAAAVLFALADSPGGLSTDAERARRDQCIAHLTKGRSTDGGWGPYVNSPPEVFDTALAVLALAPWAGEDGVREMIRGGRAWLIAAQQPDGSWPETTRPPGGVSYAQRMSTTGWAAAALLATRAIGE